MRTFLTLLLLFPVIASAQKQEEAEQKVNQGVQLHDQGKYKEALDLYEQALALDKNNLLALSEKAMTLDASGRHEEAVETSRTALAAHPGKDLRHVYLLYANALDHLKEPENAIKIYDMALAKYPDYYQLYYNKAITLFGLKKTEEASGYLRKATQYNPSHIGSFNALSVIDASNRIPALMISCRYLILENKSARAKAHFARIGEIVAAGVEKTGENAISLTLNPGLLDDVANEKQSENNFSATDMILSMAAALEYDEKNKDKTDCQKFIAKMESVFESLDEMKSKSKGYYWEFLAPYFIDLKKNGFLEAFAYVVYFPSQQPDVLAYHEKNAKNLERFYRWSKEYAWPKMR